MAFMYEANLIMITILYPILARYFMHFVDKVKSGIFLWLSLIVGLIFTYVSTFLGYTFENNILDIMIINIFIFSIFGLATLIHSRFYSGEQRLRIFYLTILSVTVFILFNSAFGPSEACGQRFPQDIHYVDGGYKITHAGFQYGFMDYGSRFIVYKRNLGVEKIIGMAENTTIHYREGCDFQMDLKNKTLLVHYNDYQNKQTIDSLHIHEKQ